jgi:hypothetical protein
MAELPAKERGTTTTHDGKRGNGTTRKQYRPAANCKVEQPQQIAGRGCGLSTNSGRFEGSASG